TVNAISDLKINNFSIDDITCYDAANGAVSATISDGRYSTVSCKLENKTDGIIRNTETNTANATFSMTSLNTGAYQLVFHDGCTAAVVKELSINQRSKVIECEFMSADALCANPSDGTASVAVNRSADTYDTIVSNTLIYTLTRNAISHN